MGLEIGEDVGKAADEPLEDQLTMKVVELRRCRDASETASGPAERGGRPTFMASRGLPGFDRPASEGGVVRRHLASAGRAVPQLRQRVGDRRAQSPLIASSVRIDLALPSRSTLVCRTVSASFSCAISGCRAGCSRCLDLSKVVAKRNGLRLSDFGDFASTSFGDSSTFDSTASVIVAAMFSAKWSMRVIATSATIGGDDHQDRASH